MAENEDHRSELEWWAICLNLYHAKPREYRLKNAMTFRREINRASLRYDVTKRAVRRVWNAPTHKCLMDYMHGITRPKKITQDDMEPLWKIYYRLDEWYDKQEWGKVLNPHIIPCGSTVLLRHVEDPFEAELLDLLSPC